MVSCFLNFSPFAYNADPRDFIRVCLFCFRMNKGDFVSLIQMCSFTKANKCLSWIVWKCRCPLKGYVLDFRQCLFLFDSKGFVWLDMAVLLLFGHAYICLLLCLRCKNEGVLGVHNYL